MMIACGGGRVLSRQDGGAFFAGCVLGGAECVGSEVAQVSGSKRGRAHRRHAAAAERSDGPFSARRLEDSRRAQMGARPSLNRPGRGEGLARAVRASRSAPRQTAGVVVFLHEESPGSGR